MIEFTVAIDNDHSVKFKLNGNRCQVGGTTMVLERPLTISDAKLIAEAYSAGLWDGAALQDDGVRKQLAA